MPDLFVAILLLVFVVLAAVLAGTLGGGMFAGRPRHVTFGRNEVRTFRASDPPARLNAG